jgi:hypothetical protein
MKVLYYGDLGQYFKNSTGFTRNLSKRTRYVRTKQYGSVFDNLEIQRQSSDMTGRYHRLPTTLLLLNQFIQGTIAGISVQFRFI